MVSNHHCRPLGLLKKIKIKRKFTSGIGQEPKAPSPLLPTLSKFKYKKKKGNGPKYPTFFANGPKYPKVAQNNPKWPKIPQSGPKYPKVAQNTPKWPKIPQSGPKYPKMAQNTPKWPKIHRTSGFELVSQFVYRKAPTGSIYSDL